MCECGHAQLSPCPGLPQSFPCSIHMVSCIRHPVTQREPDRRSRKYNVETGVSLVKKNRPQRLRFEREDIKVCLHLQDIIKVSLCGLSHTASKPNIFRQFSHILTLVGKDETISHSTNLTCEFLSPPMIREQHSQGKSTFCCQPSQ